MLWRLFHRSKIGRYAHGEQPWALVTGASDGIGRGIALELLAQGFNVILHGRNATKLATVQTDLAGRFPERKIALLVIDASSPEVTAFAAPAIHSAIASVLSDKRLTVLVNNLGFTSTYTPVLNQSPEEIDIVTTVAMRFMTHATRACLPHLVKNSPGLVINVSGLTRSYPSPFLAIHSGSKSYILGFSHALALECEIAGHDIESIGVDVHNVSSNSNSSTPSFFTPTAEVEGKAIVGVVGCGKRVVTGYWRHELMTWILALIPGGTMDKIMSKEMVAMKKRELDKVAANKRAD